MNPIVQFQVIGDPAAQGSKRQVRTQTGQPIMIEASKKTGPWRDSVSAAAADAAQHIDEPLDGALQLSVRFRFSMPKSRPRHARIIGWCWKTSAPDLDKLIRAVGDALKTGGLVVDDARFVKIIAEKVEVYGSWTGATIAISRAREPGAAI